MPGELIPIVLFIMAGITVILTPIARAYARRLDRQATHPPAVPADLAARLDRMEQAIDAIAVEVERISEGQRFTTRLLSDRTEGALPAGAAPRQVAAAAERGIER